MGWVEQVVPSRENTCQAVQKCTNLGVGYTFSVLMLVNSISFFARGVFTWVLKYRYPFPMKCIMGCCRNRVVFGDTVYLC